jgi:hypothetical protein
MMKAEPQKEHAWLQKLVGEWIFEGECVMGPQQPPMKSTGVESVRSLGGLWAICEGRGEMPDGSGPSNSIMTLGYDPQKGCFVGSFVASMMSHLWIYERGTLDSAGKVLTLEAKGPSFSGDGKIVDYQDIIEWTGDDNRTLSSRMRGEDGSWTPFFMTARYRRKG